MIILDVKEMWQKKSVLIVSLMAVLLEMWQKKSVLIVSLMAVLLEMLLLFSRCSSFPHCFL